MWITVVWGAREERVLEATGHRCQACDAELELHHRYRYSGTGRWLRGYWDQRYIARCALCGWDLHLTALQARDWVRAEDQKRIFVAAERNRKLMLGAALFLFLAGLVYRQL